MASDAIHTIPPPPSSAPRSSRDPQNPLAVMSLASIRVQAVPPSAPPSAPQQMSPVSHRVPMYQPPPTTARMPSPSTPAAFTTTPSDAPVVMPSVPPGASPSAPPSSPASVRYERAFRSWSYSSPPPNELESGDPEASQGPLTYQVYTPQDIAVAPRMSRVNFPNAPPPPVPLHKRVGMMITGAAIVLCTAAAVILGVVDDGPKAPREAGAASNVAPLPAFDPAPVGEPDPAAMTTTTSFIPPVVTIVDDPNAQPAMSTPKPKKKKISPDGTASGSGSVITVSANANQNAGAAPAPPPNPYAVSKK
jgi:hypothetical protein